MPHPNLRPGLVLRGCELFDPMTGARYALDEAQASVVAALDGKHSIQSIATEVLVDPEAAGVVEAFVRKLQGYALLEEPLPEADLIRRQRGARREQAARERDARLVEQLRRLAAEVPFYRDRLGGVLSAVGGAADLWRVPLMTKRDVRASFAQLMPAGDRLAAAMKESDARIIVTSGSSGERLEVMASTAAGMPLLINALEAPVYQRRWPPRVARFTTPVCSGTECHLGKMPYEERVQGDVLTLNSSQDVLDLEPRQLEEILAEVERFAPTVLLVDPVYGVALVRALQRQGLPLPKVELIWTTYEYLSTVHRRILSEAFGVPVVNDYGATELGGQGVARECERGTLHVNPRMHLELVRGDRAVEAGELGEVVATALTRDVMVLVRYRTGDLARAVEGCDCSLGHLPGIQIEGRVKDCVPDAAGEPVTTRQIDGLFEGLRWLDFYQLAQNGPGQYEVRGIPGPVNVEADQPTFLERARGLLGSRAEVRVRPVRHLASERSLKYRLTSSRLWSATEW